MCFEEEDGVLKERQAGVQTEIPTLMSTFCQFARQFPIPASQIQNRFVTIQPVEHASDTWLDALAGCRKGIAESCVKVSIKLN